MRVRTIRRAHTDSLSLVRKACLMGRGHPARVVFASGLIPKQRPYSLFIINFPCPHQGSKESYAGGTPANNCPLKAFEIRIEAFSGQQKI